MSGKEEGLVAARPTNRLGNQVIESDGDTWQETLVVCEAPTSNKKQRQPVNEQSLILRSYYENVRNGKRVWDEPPSGASRILPATEEMRRMAEVQMQELVVTTLNHEPATTTTDNSTTPTEKKRGWFGFRKKNNPQQQQQQRKIQYKAGSSMIMGGNSRKQRPTTQNSNTFGGEQDPQLQEAIARSIAEVSGQSYRPTPMTPSITTTEMLEQEQLAQALSLSVADAEAQGQVVQRPWETEDQMLQRLQTEQTLPAKTTSPPPLTAEEVNRLNGVTTATAQMTLDVKPSPNNEPPPMNPFDVPAPIPMTEVERATPPRNLKAPPSYAQPPQSSSTAGLKKPPPDNRKPPPTSQDALHEQAGLL